MKRVKAPLMAAVLLWAAYGVAAQEPQEPAWVLFEKGKMELASRGELGVALHYFRQALDKRAPFPEVEEAIGDIHRLEGNFLMAEIQYLKAYDLSGSFQVREVQYRVLQKLAEIYKTQEKYKQMEDILLTILRDQPYFAKPEYKRFSDALFNTYREKGIDHFLKLYRVEDITFAARAHEELSWFYYRTGRYQQAVRHGLFGINIVVTEAVPEIRKIEPDFEFTDLKSFTELALSRANIREYLAGENFFSRLYILAAASHAAQMTVRANAIWGYLAAMPDAESFRELARRQLESPWVEPYLDLSAARKIEYPAQ